MQALGVLSDCRTTLMFTYVFAYYLSKSNECDIFEANQKDLELATEVLSGVCVYVCVCGGGVSVCICVCACRSELS